MIEDAARVDPYLDELGIDAETVQPPSLRASTSIAGPSKRTGRRVRGPVRFWRPCAPPPGGDKFPFGYERVVAPVMAAIINNNNVAYRFSHDYQMFVKASNGNPGAKRS